MPQATIAIRLHACCCMHYCIEQMRCYDCIASGYEHNCWCETVSLFKHADDTLMDDEDTEQKSKYISGIQQA